MLPIKTTYNFIEMSILLQCHRNTTGRRLRKLHIPYHKVGREHQVFLSDLRDLLPDLYDTLLEFNNLSSFQTLRLSSFNKVLQEE